ncbi:MAG: ATPase, T2SS/T4P/T4SS family [Candidatus Spechtbacterales bacterium]|nr:ATPase, T2SS/T4P/T4SS family [Candidatus Spechtbacterales bacterium]
MRITNKQLKAFIEDANLVDSKELEKAMKKAEKEDRSVGEILLQKGLITEEKLASLRAYIAGVPYVDLTKVKIDPEVLHIIPESIARKNNIIAYKREGNNLEVAMEDPTDIQTVDFIRKKSGLKILPRYTSEKGIKSTLKLYEESLEKEFEGLVDKEEGEIKLEKAKEGEEVMGKEELAKEAEELPIIRIVDSILRHAITQRASDIHIEPEEKDVLVRYRIDGILHDAMTLPKKVQDGVVARIKILSNLRLDEHRLPQDGRFTIKSDEGKVSFRVSILPVFDGEKVVLRLLREEAKGFGLEELGYRGEALERLERAIRKPLGMILATGPTGSGKTTTLYTLLDIVNEPGVNISTVEDPIEYRMPRINQTQIKPQIGLTFANGLRALVRQDPDVIMVGEIRDEETASLGINAALTGHLVLSTIHTNSAAGAMPRLIDMGQEPFLISSTLILAVGQRLVRKLCPKTKEKYTLSKKELESLEREVDLDRMLKLMKDQKAIDKNTQWEDIEFYKAKPSEDCPDGYKGRLGIYEVLEVTETIRKLISENATIDEIEDQAKKEGMTTMLEDGIIKAAQGITTLEEVFRVTSE